MTRDLAALLRDLIPPVEYGAAMQDAILEYCARLRAWDDLFGIRRLSSNQRLLDGFAQAVYKSDMAKLAAAMRDLERQARNHAEHRSRSRGAPGCGRGERPRRSRNP